MVSYVTNTNVEGRKRRILRNPPSQTVIVKKKNILGRVNAWKTRREKWWHDRFPNLITYILLIQPVAQSSDTGFSAVLFHHIRVVPVHVVSP